MGIANAFFSSGGDFIQPSFCNMGGRFAGETRWKFRTLFRFGWNGTVGLP